MGTDALAALVLVTIVVSVAIVTFIARRERWSWRKLLGSLSIFVVLAALTVAGLFRDRAVAPLVALGVSVVALGVYAHFVRVSLRATENRLRDPQEPKQAEGSATKALRDADLVDLREERRTLRRRMAGVVLGTSLMAVVAGVAAGSWTMGVVMALVVGALVTAPIVYTLRPIGDSDGAPDPSVDELPGSSPLDPLDSSILDSMGVRPQRPTDPAPPLSDDR